MYTLNLIYSFQQRKGDFISEGMVLNINCKTTSLCHITNTFERDIICPEYLEKSKFEVWSVILFSINFILIQSNTKVPVHIHLYFLYFDIYKL